LRAGRQTALESLRLSGAVFHARFSCAFFMRFEMQGLTSRWHRRKVRSMSRTHAPFALIIATIGLMVG